MAKLRRLYRQVYQKNQLFGVTTLVSNPFATRGRRPYSVAITGGALGDEGKGRVTDELTAQFLRKNKQVIHYRDNGGANAGHNVEFGSIRIALHQLGAGILQSGCVVVLGKEMVLHPEDLVTEIQAVKKAAGGEIPAQLIIDEMAFLSLDTHRAFEAALKDRAEGSKGSTGRGISPAYADVIYRMPLRMRDFKADDWEKRVIHHYDLYADWIKGMGSKMATMMVPRLTGSNIAVGSRDEFIVRLGKIRKKLLPFIQSVNPWLTTIWESDVPMVFEKAQALGLDKRWGVYPDVTASDCSFEGILSSTEGMVDPLKLAVKASTIKATYTSTVGSRVLPTMMKEELANRIREDADEYGATTKRPRGIAYLDLPMLKYLHNVGRVEYLVMTHLDISYPEVPIKVCIDYEIDGQSVPYRPDQEYLNTVTPVYVELPSWDGQTLRKITSPSKLPKATKQFIAFVKEALNVKILMATTGPKREQTIRWWK